MGFDIGGGSSGMKLSGASKNANNMLMQALNPALISGGGGGFGNKKGFAGAVNDSGLQVGSSLQGLPGVLTFDNTGAPVGPGGGSAVPGMGGDSLPTLLPSFQDIGTYNTLGENFSAGNMDPASAALYGEFLNTSINGPNQFDGSSGYNYFEAGIAAAGGGSVGGGSVGYTPPPSIGELTSDIIADLPPNMQDFINTTLEDPSNFESHIANFENAVMEATQLEIEQASMATMDAFSAQGLGTSGSAIQGMKEIAVNATIKVNEKIAAYRFGFVQEQTKRIQIGEQLVKDLMAAGAAEQANLVALETQKMASNAAIMQSQIAAQAQLNSQLISAGAQLEAARMSSFTSLELGRMDMLTSGYQGLLGENAAENQAKINSLKMPYDILSGIATGNPSVGGGTDSSFGLDLGDLVPILPGQ